MKFSLKMTLSVIVLLALCLSLNGFLLINTNFNNALETISAQNAERHYKDAYQIERECALYAKEQRDLWFEQYSYDGYRMNSEGIQELYAQYGCGEMFVDRALQQAGRSLAAPSPDNSHAGISIRLANGSPVYTSMTADITQNEQISLATYAEGASSRLIEVNGKSYMLLASRLLVNYRDAVLVSAYDVSPVFASRDAQLKSLSLFTGATLLVAIALVALLSKILTRPLAKLQKASERIAGGDYDERTAIATDDEFGALSASFDSMASAVEQNVGELRESVREREDFVGAFTHEIKTPMTSMLGYAAILRKGESEIEQQRAAADYIWRETKRLEGLSQKLMILMGLKKEELALEPVSIKALFSTLQKTLPKATHSVNITFKNPGNARVLADRVLLDDLVRNLIINAQRACADGGNVEVCCEAGDGEALMYVKDDGCGIPADELAKITEPFYMVDKSRARAENGSGMGLALGARIAELHGAMLEFQSEVGRGTMVSFRLPLAEEEAK